MNNYATKPDMNKDFIQERTPLQGRLEFVNSSSGRYGVYVKNTFVKDGKICHNKLYLGKVISETEGLFHSKKRGGYFTFSLEKGYEIVDDPYIEQRVKIPADVSLHFGDVWMIEQLSKQIGLDKVMESVCPESADTMKALVAFKVINHNQAYCYAKEWYRASYANVLYPKAVLDSPRISEFNEKIGQETNYQAFFKSYFSTILKKESILDKNAYF
ncbi:MAG: hypothetical protein LBE38_09780 [Deltaproteobacteria bacterium]|jgi:hypothetical protein|nr:hypothetical protein [Deltaproteobacteria bacterium]